jgi:2-polyprenyl-6-methoxyphenol hydroxylase-like FAD-dependent oxidoreductase
MLENASVKNRRVLISGGGIAGLTLGILLCERGWEPLVIERDPELWTEGYMIDFFGTGWDVAERIGIVEQLRAVKYPINYIEFVDNIGKPYVTTPISRVRQVFKDKYVYLRRSDLEKILFDWAKAAGLDVQFNTVVKSLDDNGSAVDVVFENNSRDSFSLVFGADGVHSRVRELTFGPEERFARFLGAYVTAFHTANKYNIIDSIKIFKEKDHTIGYCPIGNQVMSAFYVFRNTNAGFIPHEERLPLLKDKFKDSEWLGKQVLEDLDPKTLVFFDSLTQILMPTWSKGRIALLGDASSCLTLIAGQGSHMAMGASYVIARELERHNGEHEPAFSAYEAFLKPLVTARQDSAAAFSNTFIPSQNSRMWLRRIIIKLIFNRFLLGYFLSSFGAKSVLRHYE